MEGIMNPRFGAVMTALSLTVLFTWPAFAEVPAPADFAACNLKAAEDAASDAVSASPRTDQAPRSGQLPADARVTPPSMQSKTMSSDKDPQIDGLAADRANDPGYVAAYRSCMRQRGF
jgi:hypothetical protein